MFENHGGQVGLHTVGSTWLYNMLGEYNFLLDRVAIVLFDADSRNVDRALRRVVELSHISELYLEESDVSDNGLSELHRIPGLMILALHSTDITDKGLQHIHKCTRLQAVDLYNTHVTDKGAYRLLVAIPYLQLNYDWDNEPDFDKVLEAWEKIENAATANN